MTNSDDAQAGVRPGDVLAGKYRVERVLGVGGMGVVVAAHHLQLDEKVALKFLLPATLGNAEAVARFAREAQAAVKIKNEHVARVTDVGALPNGAPYMVMEYLEGNDLSVWLKRLGKLPIDQAVEFVLQACVAVADAHALGIVHRDLKPANLFCLRRSDGQFSVKVLDFGISKMTAPGSLLQGGGTRTSAMMGSPYYMSPEQMRSSKDVDSQADIWAIGIILFELISGRPPFLSDSVMDLAILVASEPPPLLRSVRPDAPPALEAVVSRCLEKEKKSRYANVAELAVALLPFAPSRARTSVDRIIGIIDTARRLGSGTPMTASSRTDTRESSGLSPKGGTVAARSRSGAGLQSSASDTEGRDGTGPTFPAVGRTTLGVVKSKGKVVAVTAGLTLALASIGVGILVWQRGDLAHIGASGDAKSPVSPTLAAVPATKELASGSGTPPLARVVEVVPEPPLVPPPFVAVVKPPVRASGLGAGAAKPALRAVGAQPAVVERVADKPVEKPAEKPLNPQDSQHDLAAEASKSPNSAAKCDPPYYFDDKGNRIFRKECL